MKKVWRISRSAKGLLIVSITLDGLVGESWTIHQIRQTSPRQTFLLYGTSKALPHNNYVKTFEGEKFCEFVVLCKQ